MKGTENRPPVTDILYCRMYEATSSTLSREGATGPRRCAGRFVVPDGLRPRPTPWALMRVAPRAARVSADCERFYYIIATRLRGRARDRTTVDR